MSHLEMFQFPQKSFNQPGLFSYTPKNAIHDTKVKKVKAKRQTRFWSCCEKPTSKGTLSEPATKSESGSQTVLHPVETNIVKSYEWNEWELRRKAMHLANIRARTTHSTQTKLSHLRRENSTQTWLLDHSTSQSKKDGHSGVPRPSAYLLGLRGHHDSQVTKVNLTRCVDEE